MLLLHGLDVYFTNDMPCVTMHGLDVYFSNDMTCVTSAWAGCVLNQ